MIDYNDVDLLTFTHFQLHSTPNNERFVSGCVKFISTGSPASQLNKAQASPASVLACEVASLPHFLLRLDGQRGGLQAAYKKHRSSTDLTIQIRVKPQTDMTAKSWLPFLMVVLYLGIFGKLRRLFFLSPSSYWGESEDISHIMRQFWPLNKL